MPRPGSRTGKTTIPTCWSVTTSAASPTSRTRSTDCRKTISSARRSSTPCSSCEPGRVTTRREKEEQVVIEGRVVADFGREFLVEFADRRQVVCTRKGKRQDATCGDFVEVRLTGAAQGSIERIGTRRNVLFRSDQWKEKMLAANVDQVVILLAPKPPYSEAFLNLSLVACEAARLPVVVALNKADLPEHAEARKALALYSTIGYTVIAMSAKGDISALQP